MALALANPTFAAEVARLARCFDAVGPLFAAACAVPGDELQAAEDQSWLFSGGGVAVTWSDDVLRFWGGSLGYEESAFGGTAHVKLVPTGEYDSMSERRAFVVLSLKAMAARGTFLAGECATVDLGDIRHVYPAGDDEVAAMITVPFRLRIVLQTTLGVHSETLTTSAETRHTNPQ